MTTPFIEKYIEAFNKLNEGQDQGTVLLARLGDFYEAYYTSAQLLGRCGATVCYRYCIPMAGVPYHCLDKYTSKLLDMGYRVCLMELDGSQTLITRGDH